MLERLELALVALFEYFDKSLGPRQLPGFLILLKICYPMHKLTVDLSPLLVPHCLTLDVSLQVAIYEQHSDAIKLEADVLRSFRSQRALKPKWQCLRLNVSDVLCIFTLDEYRQVHRDLGRRGDEHDLVVMRGVWPLGKIVQYLLVECFLVRVED